MAAAGAAATIVVGITTHFLLPAGAETQIVGDGLYALLVYLLVVVVVPRAHPAVVAALGFGWCLAVELFQLTGLPAAWGAAFAPVMFVLGTVFDPRDLLVYAIATALAAVTDAVGTGIRHHLSARRASRTGAGAAGRTAAEG